MEFNVYYYENYEDAAFDEDNPRFVMALPSTGEIMEALVLQDPYCLERSVFKDQETVDRLINIDVIKEKDGKLAIGAAVLVEADLPELMRLSKSAAEEIFKAISKKSASMNELVARLNNGFSNKINLYHLLCGQIFDGYMFDYLEEEKLVTTSLVHKSGLDYIVTIYEKSQSLEKYSDGLLCSYNRLSSDKGCFASFGDSSGERQDFYRFMRRKELGQLSDEEKCLVNCEKAELINSFKNYCNGGKLTDQEKKVFEYFGYIRDGKICVPVYTLETEAVIEELYQLIIDDVKAPISQAIGMIADSDLLSVKSGVAIGDIANEIYHLIFGEVNELLVKENIVACPEWVEGQGRFLRSFEIWE